MAAKRPGAGMERLDAQQRAAATAPPGPVLCIAPAGSGKTTTLIGRVAWRLSQGADPTELCVLTFNRRAAGELRVRLRPVLTGLGHAPDAVRVRTFHALGREILLDAGRPVEPLVERTIVLRELSGETLTPLALRRLDDAFARLKLDEEVTSAGPTDPAVTAAFRAYEAHLAATGALDHDDLVRRGLLELQSRPNLLAAWRRRCRVLLVDEVQDLDRAQWRLAFTLSAPGHDVFLVGDDDQTIYAWRLADARRILGIARELPGLRRFHLVVNYRCPPEVVSRAVRLVSHNNERFEKAVRAADGATGRLHLVPDPGDDVARARSLLEAWAPQLTAHGPSGRSHAVLARTNAELAPFAAVALELGLAYRAADDGLLLDEPRLDLLFSDLASAAGSTGKRLISLARTRRAADPGLRSLLGSVSAWAARDAGDPADALERSRRRRAELRDDQARLILATAHGTKGLEFDVVACVGLDAGRFPSARSLEDAPDPARALEEERRLAYVAWTRARAELLLIYDPGAPSPFLREAFAAEELACAIDGEPTP